MAVLLALVTIALYWPVMRFDFVNYDDPVYVTENPRVQAGLSWAGLAWAFGRVHGEGTYWHPLTWVSHMVDCQLYGLKPWGHHLTSVLVHAANAVLVFLVFRRMTGAFWRCAVLAGLFAVHPLQVDSVAWVTERKNLLSTFFWLLTTWAYVRYAECRRQNSESSIQKPEGRGPWSVVPPPASFFYGLSLVLFALGLMCKPVLVTLPFVLLLLDYWPLQRLRLSTLDPPPRQSDATAGQLSTMLRLVGEKIPFFVLAVASSAITILAHRALGMLDSASRLPWDLRLENALVSYVRYLGKTFWPSRLAVFYPYPAAWPRWEVVTCGLLLLVISALVLSTARRRPWLWVGWFWFLGVLVPFSGLIQAGEQAMADRFMYVPVIGLMVAVIWGLAELAKRGRYQQIGLSVAGGAAIVLCLALTRHQLGYWQDSESLFRHALEVTENNALAHTDLGVALDKKGQTDEAIRQLQEAIRLKPDDAIPHYNLGVAVDKKGQTDEAMRQFQEAIRLKADYAEAHNNLGVALAKKGQMDEAISQYQEALRLKPDDAMAHYNLGLALDKRGQTDEAIRQFQEAICLKPDDAMPHYNLGLALAKKGQVDQAISQYREALRLKPDDAEAHNNLGVALDQQGRIAEAISQYQEALRLKPDDAMAHYNLGVALGKKGQTDEAIVQVQEAIRLKPDYADAHNSLGVALEKKGQMDEAIRQFQEAIRLKPDDAIPHYNLGVALGKKGQMDEAVGQVQEAIRLKPDHADAHNSLGVALGKKGQTDEAIRQFQEAIHLKPDDAIPHYNLGVALDKKGEMDEAIRQFQEALRLKPDYAEARKHLDDLVASKGDSSQPPGAPANR